MVVKMMRWRPWPPLSSKKFVTRIMIHRLEGLCSSNCDEDFAGLAVEIRWKGSKANALTSLRRSLRRNLTREEGLKDDGVVEWNEEFQGVCNFSAYKEGLFHPWEVLFTVFKGLNKGQKDKVPVIGTASLNLAEFASAAEKDNEMSIPLAMPNGSIKCSPSLCTSTLTMQLSLSLLKAREPSDLVPNSVASEKDELSALKAGLRKVKIFKGLSAQTVKKPCHVEESSDGRSSVRSEGVDYNYPFDTDSPDDQDEEESEEGKEDSSVRKSFSYGTLAYVNHAGGSYDLSSNRDEDWIYYSSPNLKAECFHSQGSSPSVLDQSLRQNLKRSIIPWRKRKLSFRSPKAKGEPLLKKTFGEEGGDDIDFDRRQFSSSDESPYERWKTAEDSVRSQLSVSEFGDDNFAIGSWENKDIISRDGQMKLQTQVFFSSIDQRSEQAAGESACTALVAVIASWFQFNSDEMPIKSQLDSLIREGSLEWRNLCKSDTYRERFADKHFDLETVLEAKIRPLFVVPEKSFIGFFHPDELKEEGGFEFLHSAMSFDSIWDEISQFGSDNPGTANPLVYIVSWNDHFFVLKVESDAYYIIDTLGERLYEGCNQAYILKFDKDTTIQQLPNATRSSDKKPCTDKVESSDHKESDSDRTAVISTIKSGNCKGEESIVCRGKDSCKEYIKSFLAAIPIRELQADLKRGLMASTPLHRRLQIEFHYTQCLQPVVESTSIEDMEDILATSL
ncbi:hypothetical protein RJ639_012509 [Escallonia herrerae]|uniref:C2 NT-type domain-containing protein n=1 Tax=Escallonia herrerae TaxID=1293975 RepID=A0AA89AR98_9ASTE|nr:hypothetical protein RJ639_012509 [Escallonia herrerae]